MRPRQGSEFDTLSLVSHDVASVDVDDRHQCEMEMTTSFNDRRSTCQISQKRRLCATVKIREAIHI